MKNTWIMIIAVAVLVLFGLASAQVSEKGMGNVFGESGNKVTGNAVAVNNNGNNIKNGVQEVTLSFENYEYKLTPSEFVANVPVRMVVNLESVYGCMRDVRIPAFGVSKYVTEGDNIIEFTPTKSGTFNIMCSMGMGRGIFTVVNDNGKVAAYQEPVPEASESCGSEGGCGGCGGF